MREHWARGLAMLTGLLVVLLSAAFAALQNPGGEPAPVGESGAAAGAAADAEAVARGRALFETHHCTRCHSIAGRGSPRSPLDGIGARLDRDELRQWIVADDAVREDLSPRTIAAKKSYAALPEEELDALVAYLASLGAGG